MPCETNFATFTKDNIAVGVPNAAEYPINAPTSLRLNAMATYATNFFNDATYVWSTPGFAFSTNGSPSIIAQAPPFQGPPSSSVMLNLSNACGSMTNPIIYPVMFNPFCFGGRYVVSPNPANNSIVVKEKPNEGQLDGKQTSQSPKATTQKSLIYALMVTDRTGAVKLAENYKKGSPQVNISLVNLLPGTYTLSVFDGQRWESQQLIKQ